jgi:hypothetical protein
MTADQMTLGRIEDDLPTGKRTDPAIEARRFIAENPEAYGLLVRWARRDMAEGTRPELHGYLYLLRKMPWIKRGARAYKVNHNWSRYLVDILIADYPELGDERRGFVRRNPVPKPRRGGGAAQE